MQPLSHRAVSAGPNRKFAGWVSECYMNTVANRAHTVCIHLGNFFAGGSDFFGFICHCVWSQYRNRHCSGFNYASMAPTGNASSDITWGNLSDFTQLPLGPQKVFYNFFTFVVVLPMSSKLILMCFVCVVVCQPTPSIKSHLTVPACLTFFIWVLHPVLSSWILTHSCLTQGEL